jgi:hypothetical protein
LFCQLECVRKSSSQRLGIAEGGIFIISSLELKINRITNADKPFIAAAK